MLPRVWDCCCGCWLTVYDAVELLSSRWSSACCLTLHSLHFAKQKQKTKWEIFISRCTRCLNMSNGKVHLILLWGVMDLPLKVPNGYEWPPATWSILSLISRESRIYLTLPPVTEWRWRRINLIKGRHHPAMWGPRGPGCDVCSDYGKFILPSLSKHHTANNTMTATAPPRNVLLRGSHWEEIGVPSRTLCNQINTFTSQKSSQ